MRRRIRIVLAGLLAWGLFAGCGVQDRDAESRLAGAFGAESDVEATVERSSEVLGDSSEFSSAEFDFEERERQILEELQAWYETLTEEDYAAARPIEELTMEEWWVRQPVILSDLPEAGVKIYGEMSEGCLLILEHQGKRRTFYKDFLTPRAVLPEFCVYDYDGDGALEVGMIAYVFSGTGVAIRDFSVFDSVDEAFDTLYTMPWEDVQQVCDQVSLSYTENVLRIGLGDEYEEHSLADTPYSGIGITGLALGSITAFSFGESGEVFCDVLIGLGLEDQATPLMLDEMSTMYENGVPWDVNAVHFQVHYDGEGGFRTDGMTLK